MRSKRRNFLDWNLREASVSLQYEFMKKIVLILSFLFAFEQETDGRWIAEIDALNGILVYGETREEAIRKVGILALQVIDERLENEN